MARYGKLLAIALAATVALNIFQAVRSREAARVRVVEMQQRQAEAARLAELEKIVRVQRDHLARWAIFWSDTAPARAGWYYLKATDGTVSLVHAAAGDSRQGKWAGPLPEAPEPK